MKVLLILVLVTANGPTERTFEMPSIDVCIGTLNGVLSKVDISKTRDSGVVAYGAGCMVELAKEQESKQ